MTIASVFIGISLIFAIWAFYKAFTELDNQDDYHLTNRVHDSIIQHANDNGEIKWVILKN